MKKKSNSGLVVGMLIGIIIMLVIVIALFATDTISFNNNSNDSESTTNDELINEQTENNSSSSELDNERYTSIIEEYRTAMNDDNYYDNMNKYSNINNIIVMYYHNHKKGYGEGVFLLKYTYYDINKDGKNEMIVISSSEGYEYNIAEIYIYDGSNSSPFVNEGCLGERCSAEIYNNGIIYFYGSGGAMIHGLHFYKIGNDGYSKDTFKSFSVEYDSNRNVTITDNLMKEKTNYKNDEEVISSVVGSARKVDLSKLSWIEIK